jgi:hypothetical protein
MSYTLKTQDSSIKDSITLFITDVYGRFTEKIYGTLNNVYITVVGNGNIKYTFVLHDNREGFTQKKIDSLSEGIKLQQENPLLSSCIIMEHNGQKTIDSIKYPLIKGQIIPNFYRHFQIIEPDKQK